MEVEDYPQPHLDVLGNGVKRCLRRCQCVGGMPAAAFSAITTSAPSCLDIEVGKACLV